jgi:hypothetical protein
LTFAQAVELLTTENGEPDANMRAVFDGARAAAICDLDSLSGVNDRVQGQRLAEIDRMNTMKNVLIIGATNRPERVDRAFLLSGRLEQRFRTRTRGWPFYRLHCAGAWSHPRSISVPSHGTRTASLAQTSLRSASARRNNAIRESIEAEQHRTCEHRATAATGSRDDRGEVAMGAHGTGPPRI